MTMLLLAGGLGTRIRGLYPDLPKAMIPVAGYPFLAVLLASYSVQGVDRFVILSGHLGEKLKQELSHYRFDAEIAYFHETEQLGTGASVRRCAATLDPGDLFMVANGDSIYPGSILPEPHFSGECEAVIFGVRVPDASNFGTMIMQPKMRLLSFREKQSGAGIVNGGVYAFRREFLKRFPDMTPLSLEREVFPAALQQGAFIQVAITSQSLLDIGTPDSLASADAFFEAHPIAVSAIRKR